MAASDVFMRACMWDGGRNPSGVACFCLCGLGSSEGDLSLGLIMVALSEVKVKLLPL